jgi:rhodanese-related sulfurtransferase
VKRASVWIFALCISAATIRPAAAPVPQDDLAAAPRISQADFKKGLASDGLLVLDVRDAASYAGGHIPGSVSMPLDEMTKHIVELKAERRPIVTVCA